MALVDYSSTEEEDESLSKSPRPGNEPTHALQEPASDLPPLPARLHDLYAATTRISTWDDPALHGGRTRASPHVPGNWPSHVYIEWYPTAGERAVLSECIARLGAPVSAHEPAAAWTSCLESELGAPLPLHISLSQPLQLTTGHKDAFVDALRRGVGAAGIPPFCATLTSLAYVANAEATRWFLVVRLARPRRDQFNRLLRISNATALLFGLPPLYLDASAVGLGGARTLDGSPLNDASGAFHISLAWSLEPPSQALADRTNGALAATTPITLQISQVKVKVGNVITSIPLPDRIPQTTGYLGI